MATKTTLARPIHFYQLELQKTKNYVLDKSKHDTITQALLSTITHLAKSKHPSRYQRIGDKEIFVNEIKNIPTSGKIVVQGKLLSVRKDFFPMLQDTSTDLARDIAALQNEGVLETTHFIIQEKTGNASDRVVLCLEHNQYGPKITDLEMYLELIGMHAGIVQAVDWQPILAKALAGYKSRIGEVAKITIKVHKDNLDKIQSVHSGLFSRMKAISDHFNEEYLTVELGYNIRQNRKAPTANHAKVPKEFIKQIITRFTNKPKVMDNFEEFVVKAEDSDKQDRLNAFDMLINKVKDVVHVQRRLPSKTLDSSDMFSRMMSSWNRLNVRV